MFLIDIDQVPAEPDDWRPRYNIAPTSAVLAVVQNDEDHRRRLTRFRWGLLPPWAKDLSISARMINARSESVDEKPSFRKAFSRRRCLIPADGYLEWKKVDDGKQPFLAHRPDDGVFALAGLYERNRQATGELIESCTILTTKPNDVTGQIHDRMPVIVREADHGRWLDPAYRDTDSLKNLLVAPPDDFLRLTAVSRRVNNARNDDAECLRPVATS